MNNLIVPALAAWLIPGLGHFLQGRPIKGALLMISILLLTILGFYLGGLYYPGNPAEFGVMYWLHQAAGIGNGIFLFAGYLLPHDSPSSAANEVYRSAYFEYGGRCLALAGLLNYLAVLDAIDIAAKRKD